MESTSSSFCKAEPLIDEAGKPLLSVYFAKGKKNASSHEEKVCSKK
jgi:hypothetical protein